jgi:hypothetical protein
MSIGNCADCKFWDQSTEAAWDNPPGYKQCKAALQSWDIAGWDDGQNLSTIRASISGAHQCPCIFRLDHVLALDIRPVLAA